MIILGISGLENSACFKRTNWPGLDEREYRISQGYDAAASLVVDGAIIAAAAEERFNRKKHSGDFPVRAISYYLGQAGILLKDVDEVAHAFDYGPYAELLSLDRVSAELYNNVLSKDVLLGQIARHCPAQVHQVNHHLCHAASAFFTSGWNEGLVVVIDAMGEAQSSVFHGHESQLHKLRELPANDSLGILYSLVTLHLCFDFNSDEYKIMGLAPYGDPQRYEEVFSRMVECRPGGSVRIPSLRLNRIRDEREHYTRTREWLAENLIASRHPNDPITQ